MHVHTSVNDQTSIVKTKWTKRIFEFFVKNFCLKQINNRVLKDIELKIESENLSDVTVDVRKI
jgi:hypothetical protein